MNTYGLFVKDKIERDYQIMKRAGRVESRQEGLSLPGGSGKACKHEADFFLGAGGVHGISSMIISGSPPSIFNRILNLTPGKPTSLALLASK